MGGVVVVVTMVPLHMQMAHMTCALLATPWTTPPVCSWRRGWLLSTDQEVKNSQTVLPIGEELDPQSISS